MATLRLRPKPVDSNQDPLALVEAIANRDPEHARSIHRQADDGINVEGFASQPVLSPSPTAAHELGFA